ncbi:hypothetical protein RRG08_017709 [Elysia crispata]|uniref:Uncharacterized protein n=1 Tax=Elysia crispata TaxID=231223 RepID=A0AAE0YI41_9GAST|nr:hypothetical protein RRG08_017709 [Elysia crispata]
MTPSQNRPTSHREAAHSVAASGTPGVISCVNPAWDRAGSHPARLALICGDQFVTLTPPTATVIVECHTGIGKADYSYRRSK